MLIGMEQTKTNGQGTCPVFERPLPREQSCFVAIGPVRVAYSKAADLWLQRVANVAAVVAVILAFVAGALAYASLSSSVESLRIAQEQHRPRLQFSGRAYIDGILRRPALEVIVVNRGPLAANNVSVHFEAIFRHEVKPRYLGQLPIGSLDSGNNYTVQGPIAAETLVEWLRRAMPFYDPRQHGPSKLNAYLEYRDGTNRVWGGVDETGQDRPGGARADVDLVLDK